MRAQIGRPAVVVGTSIGGATALDFALNHPEDVSALILIDAQVTSRSGAGFLSRVFLSRVFHCPLPRQCIGVLFAGAHRLRVPLSLADPGSLPEL